VAGSFEHGMNVRVSLKAGNVLISWAVAISSSGITLLNAISYASRTQQNS
jgi:hypothetical protein